MRRILKKGKMEVLGFIGNGWFMNCKNVVTVTSYGCGIELALLDSN
jgi:hypothetical protein